MKIDKHYPFAFIYFFINAVGLPFGLLYTTILTPLFYFWIVIRGKRWIIFKFFIFSIPFIINHLINGVDPHHYLRSIALFFTVYIFGHAFHTLITKERGLDGIFKKLLISNFALTIIAILLIFTPWAYLFWSDWSFSGVGVSFLLRRLTMFTYESSYYATLMVPVFAFCFVRFILKQKEGNTFMPILMITTPLLLSLSMGVISGLAIAIFILFLINLSNFLSSKKLFYSLFVFGVAFFVILIFLLLFYRDNPIFVRMSAFLSGDDQSGRGRTTEAFQLAYQIAKEKSIWWGVGPGQLKIVGDPIIREFYQYQPTYGQVSIPNAFAETIALFGIVGMVLRIALQLFFFFKTKVLNNYFSTLLFFYIFIYQFTGSFTTNIAEYVIWILAFTNVFPQFDKHANKLHTT